MRTPTILLVDDSELFLESARQWLALCPGLQVVGTASSGAAALESVRRLAPEVVLMDANMPGEDGFETTRALKASERPPKVVMVTLADGPGVRERALEAGADAFLTKAQFGEAIEEVIEQLGFPRPRLEPPVERAPARLERLVSLIATDLIGLPGDRVEAGVDGALRMIGEQRGVDRVFVYLLSHGGASASLSHEWHRSGLGPMRDIPALVQLPLAAVPAAMLERLERGEALRLPSTHGVFGAPLQETVEGGPDRSTLVLPLAGADGLVGFVGLAEDRVQPWVDDDLALLRILGRSFARAFERRRVEDALRASEARFRAVCESSPLGIFLADGRGDCIYLNPAGERICGLSAAEARGTGWLQALHPEDRERIRARWYGTATAGQIRGYESPIHRFVRPDGSTTLVEVRAAPLGADKSGFLGVLTDVTQREQLQREREEALAREQAARREAEEAREATANILARISDAFVALDREGRYNYFNEKAAAMAGRPRAELEGKVIWEEFPVLRGTPFEEAYRRAVAEGTSGSIQHLFEGRWYEVRFYPSPNGVSIFSEEITERRLREERLRSDREYLREEIGREHNFDELVGQSPAVRHVLTRVSLVAPTQSTVLITGETGTGKEIIARAIHDASPRRDRLLVKINCAAISAGLVESELFGHEQGAFTGAVKRRKGRFELADGGTLFLDEVAELPLDTQAKLLRVLQERELERVGGTETIKVDVRVLAATNRDLAARVAEGRFRQDLYYRLNVFPLTLPPLRERRGDVPLLVHFFVQKFASHAGKRIVDVAPAAMERLAAYAWPGNVRELQNVIERAVILTRGPELELETIDELVAAPPGAPAAGGEPRTVAEVERAHVIGVLEETGWLIEGDRGAARRLGLHPNTLRSRLKRWGVRRPEARARD
jgi:PAS domain S-box-containing protein